MKFISKNLANRLAGALLFAMAGSLVVSCAKDQDKNGVEQTGETRISVNIAGIDERPNLNPSNKASAAAQQAAPKINSYGDFDVQVAYDNQLQSKSNRDKIKGSSSANGAGLKAAAIDNGVKYNLYLYQADGTFVSAEELTVGTPADIAVTQGEDYKWYALSYNSTDAIAAFDPANPVIAVPEGTDVLYAAGTISIPSGAASVALPITFKHRNSRIAIELNSMGMFGDMTGATVAVTGLNAQTGDLNIVTGEWSNLVAGATQTLAWEDFENIDPQFDDAKVAYAYTVDSVTANTVSVSVANLAITHADGVDRAFSATPAVFTYPVTPVNGSSHVLTLNLLESPIITGAGANQVRWARSNLYYEAGHNPYRFYANNVQTAENESKGYFAFGGIIPRKFATAGGIQDPCALVYPAGVWRQPTNVDFAPLTTSDALLTNVLGNILGLLVAAPAPNATGNATNGTFIDYAAAVTGGSGNTAFGAESNTLRFNHNGQVTNISALTDIGEDGLIVLNLGDSHGRDAALWTNVEGTNLLGLVGLGSRAYLAGRRSTLLGSRFMGAQGTVEPLSNIDVLGLNVVSSTFKNVRCVRN